MHLRGQSLGRGQHGPAQPGRDNPGQVQGQHIQYSRKVLIRELCNIKINNKNKIFFSTAEINLMQPILLSQQHTAILDSGFFANFSETVIAVVVRLVTFISFLSETKKSVFVRLFVITVCSSAYSELL